MGDVTTAAAKIYLEQGALAFFQIIFTLGSLFALYRIVKAQDTIGKSLDMLFNQLCSHDQRAKDMHATCVLHGEQISDLIKDLAEIKGKVG